MSDVKDYSQEPVFKDKAEKAKEVLAEHGLPTGWEIPGTRLFNFTIKPMTGVEKIAQERLEQKTKHNHTIKSDWEQYPDFELAMVAEAVLAGDIGKIPHYFEVPKYQKMVGKSYQERLVIAGALIAAEIDRLNFQE